MATLITGLGYLGAPLAVHWLERGERVVGLDNFFSTSPRDLACLRSYPTFSLVRGSVGSWRALARAFGGESIDHLYHLAAQASSHPQAASPGQTERFNLTAPRLLWEAAAAHGVRIVVLASSFRIYGNQLGGLVSENTPYGLAPDLPHLTKVYAEKLVELYAERLNWRAVAVRLGIVYGLGPVMKTDARFMTVPNLFCQRAAAGEPLQVHSGANRPMGFVHLHDAVAALVSAGENAQPGYRPANAVGEVRSVPQVAALVGKLAAQRSHPVRIEGEAPSSEEFSMALRANTEHENGPASVGRGLVPRRSPSSEQAAPSFRVTSWLDQSGFRAQTRMESGLPPVLDFFLDLRAKTGQEMAPQSVARGLVPRRGPLSDQAQAEAEGGSSRARSQRRTRPANLPQGRKK